MHTAALSCAALQSRRSIEHESFFTTNTHNTRYVHEREHGGPHDVPLRVDLVEGPHEEAGRHCLRTYCSVSDHRSQSSAPNPSCPNTDNHKQQSHDDARTPRVRPRQRQLHDGAAVDQRLPRPPAPPRPGRLRILFCPLLILLLLLVVSLLLRRGAGRGGGGGGGRRPFSPLLRRPVEQLHAGQVVAEASAWYIYRGMC